MQKVRIRVSETRKYLQISARYESLRHLLKIILRIFNSSLQEDRLQLDRMNI